MAKKPKFALTQAHRDAAAEVGIDLSRVDKIDFAKWFQILQMLLKLFLDKPEAQGLTAHDGDALGCCDETVRHQAAALAAALDCRCCLEQSGAAAPAPTP